MAGPNLEIFKFAVYIFIPISLYYTFNLPNGYQDEMKRKAIQIKTSLQRPPMNSEEALAMFKERFEDKK